MGRFGRQKGKRGERATATDYRDMFPELASRIKRGWQTREGDDDPDICGVPGWWTENKTLAKFNTSPLDQAARDAKERGEPLAVIRANRKEPIAMLKWRTFLRMLRLVYDAYRTTDLGAVRLPKKLKIRFRRSRR